MRDHRYVISFLAVLTSPLAARPQAVSLPNHPVALVLASHNTPQQVLNGAAKLISHFNGSQKLRLAVGLQPPNVQEEQKFLEEIQDRNSPLFHHFLTLEQWNARFGPSVESEQSVVEWASSCGFIVTNRYATRLVIDVETDVATVEKALHVTVNQYQLDSTTFFSNDREPSIPPSLSGVLQSIAGLNNLQTMKPAITEFQGADPNPIYAGGTVVSIGSSLRVEAPAGKSGPGAKASSVTPVLTGGYNPSDIYASTGYDFQALYNQGHCCNPKSNPGGSPVETTIAIFGIGSYSSSDLTAFASSNGLALNVQNETVGGTPTCCSAETTLDTEWSAAMANSFNSSVNTSAIWVYEAADSHLSTFLSAINQITSDGKGRIFLTGWGCAESYCFDSASISTANAVFNTMAGIGWTMVAPSGDNGATSDCAHTSVQYPGSDPNFVAVGGTLLQTGTTGYSTEVGWTGDTAPGSCAANNGGSGGGCSAIFAAPSWQNASPACGASSRSVPDIAFNASHPQNYYFNGALTSGSSASFAAAEMAGFFAQQNAYLLYIGTIIGDTCSGTLSAPCAPIGIGGQFLYWFGFNETNYYLHLPYYDITSGCNSNDITAANSLTFFCAGPGYDMVTGWGSANMLQLAWAINTYMAGDWGPPVISFSGPTTSKWFNTNQTISWTIVDTTGSTRYPINGVSGYSSNWDTAIVDSYSQPLPGNVSGDSFYFGPQYPNATAGSLNLNNAGQGCHTAYVFAWDNAGYPSGNQTYGPVCYDTVPPVTMAAVNGTIVGGEYNGAVQVTLSATDPAPGSGVATSYYQVDGTNYAAYTGSFNVDTDGAHTVYFYSVDVAGNAEAVKSATFTIRSTLVGALQFIPITPCRVVDTRNANGPFGAPELAGNSTRAFAVRNSSCNIPSTAMAYSVNVTVVPNASLGYLTIWSYGSAQPLVSTLNSDGRIKANAAIVPAGNDTGGSVNVYVTDPTQFILDIDGYFVQAGQNSSGLQFFSLTPCRVADTRNPTGSLGGPYISGGTTRSFPVGTTCNIPASATAYSLNLTAVPRGFLEYITAWPQGQSMPLASVLNATTGTIVANAAIIPAGSPSGGISVYASNDTDLVMDVDGYFAPPATGGFWLYTLSPCRILDTRNGSGAFSGTLAVAGLSNSCNVNATAQTYVLNATVVPSGSLTYLTLWPNGQSQPLVSTVNAIDGAITSNMAIVPTVNTLVDAYASNPTQLILDISGYFAP